MVANINSLLSQALSNGSGRSLVGGAGSLAVLRSAVNSCRNKATGVGSSDTLALSEPLQALRDIGVDLTNSSFSNAARMFSFNLQYTDEQIKNVSANGYYDYRSQSLQVDFSFCSALSIKDPATGEEHQELFQFDFHMEASQIQTVRGDHKEVKEDILQFARRIFGEISKLHAEGKSIDGLVLDSEDLKELASVDDGRLLKSIVLIIDLLRNVDRMRGQNGDHVLLKPERGTAQIDERQEQREQSFSMSLSVRRLSIDSTQTADAAIETAPLQEIPESATT
ncbi:MAG: hypothetical protein AB9866_14695 [Syntrophobacteraceae bacterium]